MCGTLYFLLKEPYQASLIFPFLVQPIFVLQNSQVYLLSFIKMCSFILNSPWVLFSRDFLPDFLGFFLVSSFPSSADGKEYACSAGDLGSIPGSERCPGEGTDYALQYSCLERFMDREALRATVRGVAKSQTRLSDQHFVSSIVCITSHLCLRAVTVNFLYIRISGFKYPFS